MSMMINRNVLAMPVQPRFAANPEQASTERKKYRSPLTPSGAFDNSVAKLFMNIPVLGKLRMRMASVDALLEKVLPDYDIGREEKEYPFINIVTQMLAIQELTRRSLNGQLSAVKAAETVERLEQLSTLNTDWLPFCATSWAENTQKMATSASKAIMEHSVAAYQLEIAKGHTALNY